MLHAAVCSIVSTGGHLPQLPLPSHCNQSSTSSNGLRNGRCMQRHARQWPWRVPGGGQEVLAGLPALSKRLYDGLQAYRGDDPGAVNKPSKFSVDSGTGTGAGTAGTWGKDPEKGIEFGKERSKVRPVLLHCR